MVQGARWRAGGVSGGGEEIGGGVRGEFRFIGNGAAADPGTGYPLSRVCTSTHIVSSNSIFTRTGQGLSWYST